MKSSPNTDKSRGYLKLGKESYLSVGLPSLAILFLLISWEAAVRYWSIEKWILPGPSLIMKSLWASRSLIWQHSLQTMMETALGFGISVIVAVITATVADMSVLVRKTIYPLLVISQTIPIIAVAPLFIIWFGYGIAPKVVVVALVCFFPLTINLADGYRMVDADMIRLMSSMGATKFQIFRLVKLPAALPFLFSGLRIAGTYSVMGAVIGEWLGADKGLGILMTRSSQSFLTDRVFATILVIIFLSLAVCLSLEIAGRFIIPWHYRNDRKG